MTVLRRRKKFTIYENISSEELTYNLNKIERETKYTVVHIKCLKKKTYLITCMEKELSKYESSID